MRRRRYLAFTGIAATAGCLRLQNEQTEEEDEKEGEPAWDHSTDSDGGFEDARGEDTVTVSVGAEVNGGNLAFSPARLWIDPGTTIIWVWTGMGGNHNVVTEEGPADLDSDLTAETGFTYDYTFTEDDEGITAYVCEPHVPIDMIGEVAVGDDIPMDNE